MKKFISIALAVIMVLAACPLTLFAAATSGAASDAQITTGVASIWYTKDGANTKYGDYDTLDAAVDALGALYTAAGTVTDGSDADTTIANELYAAAGSPVIKLNGNFQATTIIDPSWFNGSNDTAYTVVIDGAKSSTENYTVTFGTNDAPWSGKYGFEDMAYYNSVFKNVNFVINRGASTIDGFFHGGGSWQSADFDQANITFENCVIDENSTIVGTASNGGEGGLFKLNGRPTSTIATDKYNLTFKDCTVDASTALNIQVLWYADADINFVNTTWTLSGTAGKNSNNSIVKAMRCGKVNVNVDGTSKLIAARSEGCASVAMLLDGNAGTEQPVGAITYNLAKGAELTMNNTGAASLARRIFISNESTGVKVTINDSGAIYKVSANDAKNGVTLPTFLDENNTDHIWKADGTAVANPYKNASATATVTLTHEKNTDPAANPSNVAYVQCGNGAKTYYTSLSDAVNSLSAIYAATKTKNVTDEELWEAAGKPTIYLTRDFEITSPVEPSWWNVGYFYNRVRTVVIKSAKADGSNAVITSKTGASAIRYNAYYNLTLENVDLDCTNGFALFWSGYNGGQNSARSTTNLINCNITATGSSGEGLVFKVTGNQNQTKSENYIINLVNTNVNAVAKSGHGVNAVFLFHHGAAGQLNIDGNSSITHVNDRNSAGGDTMFMLGSHRTFEINVASGAELTSKAVNANAGLYAMFRTEDSNAYAADDGKSKNIINIESGAKLNLTAADGFTKPLAFINQITPDAKGGSNINIENGVIFTVDAKTAALGFDIIKGTYGSDTILSAEWKAKVGETESTSKTGSFAAGALSGAATITPSLITLSDFELVNGAGLKTEGNLGMSFKLNIGKIFYDYMGENATYGIIVAPTEYTQFGFDKDILSGGQLLDFSIAANKLTDASGDKTTTIGFSGIPTDKSVFLKLSVRGYASYYDTANSKTVTYYTADTLELSLYDLALIAAENGYADNANVKTILGQLK